MKKVVLSKRFRPEAMEKLQAEFELVIAEETGKELSVLLREHDDTEGLISFLSDPIDQALINSLPRLKVIANYAVGYNNIDFRHAIARGIWVTHTPDALTNATADLTMALILAVSRRIVEADAYLRAGRFAGWGANLLLGRELAGAVLGIVGMGRIGLATALRGQAFGMIVVYHSRSRKPELEKKHGFRYLPLRRLIQTADIVSLHLPYGPKVHHLFNRETFGLMKRSAIFINVARGGLMDEACLAEKLEKEELFGAGLDVYEFEPQVTEKLKKLKNTVLLPHIGSATDKTRLAMAMMTVQAVRQTLAGCVPDHLIPEWRRRVRS